MSYATRDDFFAATKRRFAEVTLWNGKQARIRSLTEGEWQAIDIQSWDLKKGTMTRAGVLESNARLIAAAVVDGEGNPIFTELDVPRLSAIDAALLEPLVRDIRRHCGLRGDVEDALKNFAATEDDASPSS